MRSGSACKRLSLRSFSLDIVDQLSVECSAGWYAGTLDSVASPFDVGICRRFITLPAAPADASVQPKITHRILLSLPKFSFAHMTLFL
jgi:hypothetical protein